MPGNPSDLFDQNDPNLKEKIDELNRLLNIRNELSRKNFKIMDIPLDGNMTQSEINNGFVPDSCSAETSETDYFYRADCGCLCTVKPTKSPIPYLKAKTWNGKMVCSQCLRFCKYCRNKRYMMTEGKDFWIYGRKTFVCDKHIKWHYFMRFWNFIIGIFYNYESVAESYEHEENRENNRNP